MTIRISLTHKTSYRYDRRISLGPQTIRLRPAPHTRTPIVSYSQTIRPGGHFLNWQQDPFGNYQARAVFPEKTDHFDVVIDLVADMIAINPFDFFLDEDAFHAPFVYAPELLKDLAPYLEVRAQGEKFKALAQQAGQFWCHGPKDLETVNALVELNQRVNGLVDYVVRMEPGVQTPEETLTLGRGSCRDSAWLLVNILRHVGVAARFVSGYLVQLAADEIPLDGPAGPDADFTDLHAWAEAYIPGAGWIGLDPTSGLFAGEGHIPLAATPNPQSAAPISGAIDECEVTLDFDMTVSRLREPARITKPFTDSQWSAVDAAGQAVEAVLKSQDVRLTQGGEPTFVAAMDRDAPEWTIEAVGPTKRAYADQLTRRLMDRFAPGGVLTHGQGKWYPGEPLPRWAFGITWRTDGVPLWRNPDLIATEGTPPTNANSEAAQVFAEELAETLNLNPAHAQPLYEDPAEYIMAENALPNNVTPDNSEIDDPVERARMARIFSQGLSKPAAFVVPIQPAQADASSGRVTEWFSEIWRTRRKNLFLVPGDSPAGFRLPIQSLPFVPATDFPHVMDVDPFAPRSPLPTGPVIRRQTAARKAAPDTMPTAYEGVGDLPPMEHRGPSKHDLPTRRRVRKTPPPPQEGRTVRTAMVVEPRGDHLHVFLPPTGSAEAFVDLINAIEEVAEVLNQPVRIEGYPPPKDPRFKTLAVTPDPGVIEVNIHPSDSWSDLRDKTQALYEEARICKLDASGFMIDGRPTGSGGGAHVTLGGPTAPDSPFLRRPDVLGSLIRFWQNHPSMSYFFAGLFLGPTSQAPRVDEAREDALYELGIALDQLPGPDQSDFPPWLVDRILRNLLVDVTGNTHRSEICIDKLYSPDGPAGRIGLVEFRAFEMPPHWQMNTAQQLVVRALIAWFWQTPYTAPLKPFGTALHDRYMLPDVLWADLGAALDKIQAGIGVRIEREWFRAQYDFRFPLSGRIEHGDVSLELRSALEPWPVLGEEGAASGVARFVDSSLDRLQVSLEGAYDTHAMTVTCNGIELPLKRGERGDQHLCGVRFRSWLPASCLHPTIHPHSPLVFDLVDPQAGRAVGGCTYHPIHPGGRNFETRPVNALEAEGRRLSRFFPFGHSPGPLSTRPAPNNPRFPWTLDMRLT